MLFRFRRREASVPAAALETRPLGPPVLAAPARAKSATWSPEELYERTVESAEDWLVVGAADLGAAVKELAEPAEEEGGPLSKSKSSHHEAGPAAPEPEQPEPEPAVPRAMDQLAAQADEVEALRRTVAELTSELEALRRQRARPEAPDSSGERVGPTPSASERLFEAAVAVASLVILVACASKVAPDLSKNAALASAAAIAGLIGIEVSKASCF